jgi:pyruvate,water dikinase
MVVEAAFGLGENVVDGERTPDHYSLDRNGTIKRSHIVG